MASASRPIITTGVAIASAATIVAATPALLTYPAPEVHVAAAPTISALAPLKVSDAMYELTALSDITLEGIVNSYFSGYGARPTKDVFGVTYYITDNALEDFPQLKAINRAFYDENVFAAANLAVHDIADAVGVNDPVVNYLIDLVTYPSKTIPATLVALTAPIPLVGPVTDAFFNGYKDATVGLPSVAQYLIDLITGNASITSATETALTTNRIEPLALKAETTDNSAASTDPSSAGAGSGSSGIAKDLTADLSKLAKTDLPQAGLPKLELKIAAKGNKADGVDVVDAQDPATTVDAGTTAPKLELETAAKGKRADGVDVIDAQDPATTVDAGTTAPKPKFNEKRINPLAGLKVPSFLPEKKTGGSSEAPLAGLTTAIKDSSGVFGKHHKKEDGTGTGGAAADGGGSDSGGGDAG